MRAVITTPDETTHDRNVETSTYANFQLMDGVRTPLQITTDHNGRRIAQVFFNICKYNSGLPTDLFTKAALDKRFSEVGSKKYKDEKKKEKEENYVDGSRPMRAPPVTHCAASLVWVGLKM